MKKTEVYILSGFLGSGKTTLLQQMLMKEKEAGRKVAVMMNELGKVSIDTQIIGEQVPLKELLDGCICCTIQDKLEAQLQSLLIDAKPDVIYIETTGAAHPVEVLDAILSPLFVNNIEIKGILTTVDGTRWLERKHLSPQLQQLLLEQVRHSDLLLINKTDQLSEVDHARIVLELQGLNSHSPVILTNFSKVSASVLDKVQLHTKDAAQKSHVKKDLSLSTFVYKFNNPVDQNTFEGFLKELPESIYRIKGYIRFTHSRLPYLFQFSYGMPIYFQEDMNLPLNMVFIGENIDWNDLNQKLEVLEADKSDS